MNLVVYRAGVPVGTLDMAPGEPFYGLTYSPEYLAAPGARALSLSLPLAPGRYDGAATMPYFEGLLPEGDVRAAIARQLRIPATSPSRLLRALGQDCAGDVTVVEEDSPFRPPATSSYAPLESGLSGIAANPLTQIARLRAEHRLSLAGGQEKIALYHDAREPIDSGWFIPLAGSPSTHILKPQADDRYPGLAFNECLCMRLADMVGMRVARAELVDAGIPILCIERYDREATGQTTGEGLAIVRRIQQEDCCQALGCTSDLKYELDGGPGIAAVAGLLLRHSENFIDDRREFAVRIAFNHLVGNCDAHAKNYSLLHTEGGFVRLAPAYDLLSTTIYDDEFGSPLSRTMGMRMGKHANIDRIDASDLALLAKDLSWSTRALAAVWSEVADAVLSCFDQAVDDVCQTDAPSSDEVVRRIWKGMKARRNIITARHR